MTVIEKAQQRMMDYTKLVAALRCRATRDWTNCGNCKYADEDDDPRGCWGTKICADAADAIEALQAEVKRMSVGFCKECDNHMPPLLGKVNGEVKTNAIQSGPQRRRVGCAVGNWLRG